MKKWLFLILVSPCLATGPKYGYQDPKLDDEFNNVYREIDTAQKAPAIFRGAGAPTFKPKKEGDIYISTTTAKVYIATSTVSSGSWAIVN